MHKDILIANEPNYTLLETEKLLNKLKLSLKNYNGSKALNEMKLFLKKELY